jgi:thymidylate kinase
MDIKIKNFDKIFFETFISSLKELKYCIIGDYDNLPNSIGHDIDIWTNDVDLLIKKIKNTCNELQFRILILNRTANGVNIVCYKKILDSLVIMKIDVMSDTSYKSFLPLVPSKIIEKNIKPFNSFYVANQGLEAAMHFLFPLFEWGTIKKEKYRKEIKSNYKTSTFTTSLQNVFGKTRTDILINLIAADDWEQIAKRVKIYKLIALASFFLKPQAYDRFFKGLFRNLYRFFKPSGFVLAFCGLDGAGKTTILNNLNKIFINVLKENKVFYSYWRPYLLPELKELFGKKNNKKSSTPVIMATDRKPKNIIISMVKLLYYVLDYIFGSLKYIGKSKKGGVVLFDRHYIDTVVFPNRFQMYLPKSIFLFFYKFMPKPDITFFLWATPDEIHRRKIEFEKEEIKQQIEDYISVGNKIKGFTPIETNTTITEEIDEILHHISKKNKL